MKRLTIVLASLVCLAQSPVVGQSEANCPRTTANDPSFGAWRTGWHGTEALAVQLGSDQVWGTLGPGFRISQKVFWWSAAYRLGTESDLKVHIESMTGAPMTARVSDTTNAYLGELERLSEPDLYATSGSPDKWMMLVGVAFPDPGCWRITGEYFGQKLTFVVETAKPQTSDARELQPAGSIR